MRLFRRRSSDPNPQLVSLQPISDVTNDDDLNTPDTNGSLKIRSGQSSPIILENGSSTPILSSPKAVRKGLSTWGKKVGRKLDQMKRSDSSEILSASPGRRRRWSPNKSSLPPTGQSATSKSRKISRVESLRHLFARGVLDKHNVQGKSQQTVTGKEEWCKNLAELYESNPSLNESSEIRLKKLLLMFEDSKETEAMHKHLIDYVLRQKSEQNVAKDFERSVSFEDLPLRKSTSENDVSELNNKSYMNGFKPRKLDVLTEENPIGSPKLKGGSRKKCDRVTSTSFDNLLSASEESPTKLQALCNLNPSKTNLSPTAHFSVDELCLFLNNLLAKCDESGYDSDSTRNGSDSPRDSIVSSKSDQQRRISSHQGSKCNSNASSFTESDGLLKKLDTIKVSLNERNCSKEKVPRSTNNFVSDVPDEKFVFIKKRSPILNFGAQKTITRDSNYKSRGELPEQNGFDSTICDKCKVRSHEKQNEENIEKVGSLYQRFLKSRNYLPKSEKSDKDFKTIRLFKDETGEMGIFIEKRDPTAKSTNYIISKIEPGGLVDKDGRIKTGDELIKVNGKRIRGISLQEAKTILENSQKEVELVIARDLSAVKKESQTNSGVKKNEGRKISLNDLFLKPLDKKSEVTEAKSDLSVSNNTSNIAFPSGNRNSESNCDGQFRSDKDKMTGMLKFSYNFESVTPRIKKETSSPSGSVFGGKKGDEGGTLPRRPKSLTLSFFTVTFVKGPGRKSLGFSIVGGKDSPKGNIGIFVKTIFRTGQASEDGTLKEGDEILAVNGTPLQGMTHAEAITMFKNIKSGEVMLHVGRRDPLQKRCAKSKSCDELDKFE